MVEVEEGGINLKFTLRRSRVYAWVILMNLFLDVWQFLYMNLNGLMHIWIVGEPRQIINSFLMFQYGRGLDNFPRGQNKYNDMDNIMNLVDRVSNRGGWGER